MWQVDFPHLKPHRVAGDHSPTSTPPRAFLEGWVPEPLQVKCQPPTCVLGGTCKDTSSMSTMILQVSMLKPSDLISWPGRQGRCDGKTSWRFSTKMAGFCACTFGYCSYLNQA